MNTIKNKKLGWFGAFVGSIIFCGLGFFVLLAIFACPLLVILLGGIGTIIYEIIKPKNSIRANTTYPSNVSITKPKQRNCIMYNEKGQKFELTI